HFSYYLPYYPRIPYVFATPLPVPFFARLEEFADLRCHRLVHLFGQRHGLLMLVREELFQPPFQSSRRGEFRGRGFALRAARDRANQDGGNELGESSLVRERSDLSSARS